MPNTYESGIIKIRQLLAESTAQFWGVDELSVWYSDSIVDVSQKAPLDLKRSLVRRTTASPSIVGSDGYRFTPTATFQSMVSIEYYDEVSHEYLRSLKNISETDARVWAYTGASTNGLPTIELYRGSVIASVVYNYVKAPSISGDLDLPTVPENLQEIAIWETVIKAGMKDSRDLELAASFQAKVDAFWNRVYQIYGAI